MSETTTTAEATIRPETYRLPRPGSGDPYFNFSRSFYYELDKRFVVERKKKLLIHIRGQGKKRGVTLIPYADVAAFVREQMEGQQ